MTPLAATDQLFFGRQDATLDQDTATRIVADALKAKSQKPEMTPGINSR